MRVCCPNCSRLLIVNKNGSARCDCCKKRYLKSEVETFAVYADIDDELDDEIIENLIKENEKKLNQKKKIKSDFDTDLADLYLVNGNFDELNDLIEDWLSKNVVNDKIMFYKGYMTLETYNKDYEKIRLALDYFNQSLTLLKPIYRKKAKDRIIDLLDAFMMNYANDIYNEITFDKFKDMEYKYTIEKVFSYKKDIEKFMDNRNCNEYFYNLYEKIIKDYHEYVDSIFDKYIYSFNLKDFHPNTFNFINLMNKSIDPISRDINRMMRYCDEKIFAINSEASAFLQVGDLSEQMKKYHDCVENSTFFSKNNFLKKYWDKRKDEYDGLCDLEEKYENEISIYEEKINELKTEKEKINNFINNEIQNDSWDLLSPGLMLISFIILILLPLFILLVIIEDKHNEKVKTNIRMRRKNEYDRMDKIDNEIENVNKKLEECKNKHIGTYIRINKPYLF